MAPSREAIPRVRSPFQPRTDGLIRGEYCNLKKNNNLTKLINLWQDKGQVKIVMSMLNNILVMLSHADKLSNASTMSNNNKSNMSHVTYHC
jgi:hypothetical protein